MNTKLQYHLIFIGICLYIAFHVSGNCITETYEDSDPLYSPGGSTTCDENIPWLQVGTRTFGFYLLALAGHKVFLIAEEEERKERELKEAQEVSKKYFA